jgi:type IV pilus assembly protein PilM
MSFVSGIRDFFGLDLGTTALRVVQLRGTGEAKSLLHYGYMPLDSTLTQSDSVADHQKLAQSVKELIAASGISTNNVAVGLPSPRVFTTLVDIDRLSDSEIAQSIQLQADSLIPTPMADSKIDWAVVGDSVQDPNKVEVLLSSVTNEYVEARLDMLESIGLNVIAFEPDGLAITRSLIPNGANGMHMILDIGNRATDLVVTMGGAPRLTRSIPTGTEAIIKSAMQNLNIDANQAEQFVTKFGLSKDKLEGQIYSAIIGTVDVLAGEIEKSIKFIKSRYPNIALERIIVTGGASSLPEFPLYIANKFGVSVEIGNAWRNVAFPNDKQNELLALSNHFAVAVGLAERDE